MIVVIRYPDFNLNCVHIYIVRISSNGEIQSSFELVTHSIINGFVRVTMLQIKRIDHHGLGQFETITNPVSNQFFKRIILDWIFVNIFFWDSMKFFLWFEVMLEFDVSIEPTNHIVEQSKLVSSHLLGLQLNDMAYSMPFIRYWNSGQMNELPA